MLNVEIANVKKEKMHAHALTTAGNAQEKFQTKAVQSIIVLETTSAQYDLP